MLNKGDEIEVRVVEVDRERGRIGLRLADDPDDRRQVRRGARRASAPAPRAAARRRRRPRRTAAAAAAATAAVATATAARAAATATAGRARRDQAPTDAPLTELDSGVRIVTEAHALRAVRRARVLDRDGLARRAHRAEAGLSHLLEHLLFRGTARYSSAEIDQIFDGMGAELNAGTGKETTSVYSRVLDGTSRAPST